MVCGGKRKAYHLNIRITTACIIATEICCWHCGKAGIRSNYCAGLVEEKREDDKNVHHHVC